ncbi:MAG: hypothetical protein ACK5MO_14070, partial [Planctomyces sp.]
VSRTMSPPPVATKITRSSGCRWPAESGSRDPAGPARQPVPEPGRSEADSQQISATTTEAAEWTDQSEVETPLDWLEASDVSDAE